jgi:hypothetical protein
MPASLHSLTRASLVVGLVSATLLPAQTQPTRQGATPTTLTLRSTSGDAKRLFRFAVVQIQNLGQAPQWHAAIDSAVALDPSFTLARAYQAFTNGAEGRAREQAIARILDESGSAPPVEVLLMLYWRESAGGRAAAAAPIIRSASELIPGDQEVAYMAFNTTLAGKSLAEVATLRREFARQFPTHSMVHNALAYQLAESEPQAALAEAAEYLRLFPNSVNAHDTYADIYVLQRNPADALIHIGHELAIDSTAAAGYMKRAAVHLMQKNVPAARADVAAGLAHAPAASRTDLTHWSVVASVIADDGKGAISELGGILGTSPTAAQAATVHERMAALEAFMGDPANVAVHMSASETGNPAAAHYALKAVVLARVGDLQGARAAAAQYTSMVPATNQMPHAVNAFIALRANDMATARSELAAAPASGPLTTAVRADYLARQGKKPEAAAAKRDVLTSAVKVDGSPAVDYLKLVAVIYAARL